MTGGCRAMTTTIMMSHGPYQSILLGLLTPSLGPKISVWTEGDFLVSLVNCRSSTLTLYLSSSSTISCALTSQIWKINMRYISDPWCIYYTNEYQSAYELGVGARTYSRYAKIGQKSLSHDCLPRTS
jgi:hypothetical protein